MMIAIAEKFWTVQDNKNKDYVDDIDIGREKEKIDRQKERERDDYNLSKMIFA